MIYHPVIFLGNTKKLTHDQLYAILDVERERNSKVPTVRRDSAKLSHEVRRELLKRSRPSLARR